MRKGFLLILMLACLTVAMFSSIHNVKLAYSLTSFSSDFETGNLSQWTGTVYGGGAKAPVVQQNTVHHGAYALETTATDGSGWSVVTKDLTSPENVLYFRSYVRFTALPDVGQFVNIYPMIAANPSLPLAYMHLYNDAGTLKWRLAYKTDSVAENFAYSNTPTIQTNQWYHVEIMYKLGNGDGEAKAWIAPSGSDVFEASPTISVSNLINDDYSIGHLQLGVYRPSSLSLSVYHDCVAASTMYIGAETTVTPPPEIRGIVSVAFDDNYDNQYAYAYPLMSARGIKGTFYVRTGTVDTYGYMTVSQLQTLQSTGNEIGSHSVNHFSLTGLTEQQIRAECSDSKQFLLINGLGATNFAFPNGVTNDAVDAIVDDYYRSGRTAYVSPYLMQFSVAQFRVSGYSSEDTSDELQGLKDIVDQVYANDGWAIIFFHNIRPTDYSSMYTTSSEDFASFLDYTMNKGVEILTVNQTLNQLPSPTPNSAPIYSNISHSLTAAGSSVTFSSYWNDDSGLSKYIFSTNITGVWVDDPAVAFTSTPGWANVTKTLPNIAGVIVGYRWRVNDIDNAWSSTSTQTLTTQQAVLPLTVSINPTNVNSRLNQPVTFNSVVTGGAAHYTYQWYLNGAAVLEATSSSFTLIPNKTGVYNVYLTVVDEVGTESQSHNARVRVKN